MDFEPKIKNRMLRRQPLDFENRNLKIYGILNYVSLYSYKIPSGVISWVAKRHLFVQEI